MQRLPLRSKTDGDRQIPPWIKGTRVIRHRRQRNIERKAYAFLQSTYVNSVYDWTGADTSRADGQTAIRNAILSNYHRDIVTGGCLIQCRAHVPDCMCLFYRQRRSCVFLCCQISRNLYRELSARQRPQTPVRSCCVTSLGRLAATKRIRDEKLRSGNPYIGKAKSMKEIGRGFAPEKIR